MGLAKEASETSHVAHLEQLNRSVAAIHHPLKPPHPSIDDFALPSHPRFRLPSFDFRDVVLHRASPGETRYLRLARPVPGSACKVQYLAWGWRDRISLLATNIEVNADNSAAGGGRHASNGQSLHLQPTKLIGLRLFRRSN